MNPLSSTTTTSTRPDEPINQEIKKTWAGVAAMEHKPDRSHAIIIEAIQTTKIDEYLTALSNIINPIRIRYISKIANARICAFLSSKSDVDYITNNHRTIKINNHTTSIRPLLVKQTKIIVSNVCPIIPNSLILNALAKYNIIPTTSISNMRASTADKRFAHILSFRRTFLIEPEQIHKLPESILINCEDTNFRIFLNADNESCYLCKKYGHFMKNCILSNNKQDNIKLSSTFSIEIDNPENSKHQNQELNNDQINTKEAPKKRTSTTLTNQITDIMVNNNPSQNNPKINPLINNKTEQLTPKEMEMETCNTIETPIPTLNDKELHRPHSNPQTNDNLHNKLLKINQQQNDNDAQVQMEIDIKVPPSNQKDKEPNATRKQRRKNVKQTGSISEGENSTYNNIKEYSTRPKRQLSMTSITMETTPQPKQKQPHPNSSSIKKRPSDTLSNHNSDSENTNEFSMPEQPPKVKTTKKSKKEISTKNPKPTNSKTMTYYEDAIEAIGHLMDYKTSSDINLNPQQAKSLLLNCFAGADITNICNDYGIELDEFCSVVNAAYFDTKDKYLKAMIQPLIKKINKLQEQEDTE